MEVIMKIIYLDKPSYLPKSAIEKLQTLGEVVVYDDLPETNEAVKRLSSADVAIVEWTDLDRAAINKISRLKCIVLVTTGYEFVDGAAARERGITLCNTPLYSKQSVAEHIFAMFLGVSKQLCKANQLVLSGKTSYTDHIIGTELYGKTLGIVGLGNIGSWVAKIGSGFGMRVIGCSNTRKNIANVEQKELDKVLAESDFVSLCLSVNSSTEGLLTRKKLALLKKSAILVNISSNSILDENSLAQMLKKHKLAGAGLDYAHNPKLFDLDNVLLSPGTAWYTQASLDRNVEMFVDTVFSFVQGSPRYIVN